MQNLSEIKKIVAEKNLFARAEAITGSSFAYCINTDNFVLVDISYESYVSNEYIVFTRYYDGKTVCNRAFTGHIPLKMVVLDAISENEIKKGE